MSDGRLDSKMASEIQRIERLEAELELVKHMDRYQRAVDRNDWEAFANLFTKDMVFEFMVDDATAGTGTHQ